ncbi:expressed unknown protein [Seminavis robusta]|uniref:Uncharacterized protein n=1 Tax=Seminavis robusta TaxID=568900 RepID=A0A9N8HE45_9STRA|nr:expressed unknown protein [Seminavis robusta]|eukprot:Sro371_g128650.1 n/a (161) ;mRNA; r:66632-67244
MIPIRPIDEELNRLHQPVITAEEEDPQWDTALHGFNVTSCVTRPTVNHGRRHSAPSIPMVTSVAPPLHPATGRYHGSNRHRQQRSMGSGISSHGGPVVYHNVVYPMTSTGRQSNSLYYGRPRHHHVPVIPEHHQHHHYYVHHYHSGTSQGSPGAIPRVSW